MPPPLLMKGYDLPAGRVLTLSLGSLSNIHKAIHNIELTPCATLEPTQLHAVYTGRQSPRVWASSETISYPYLPGIRRSTESLYQLNQDYINETS